MIQKIIFWIIVAGLAILAAPIILPPIILFGGTAYILKMFNEK